MERAHRSSRENLLPLADDRTCQEANETRAGSRRKRIWFSFLATALKPHLIPWLFDCGTGGWVTV